MGETVLYFIFLIFTGAAVLTTGALYARQPLLIGYIMLGVLLGPSAFGLVSNPDLVQNVAAIGVIFLLFLLGLNLHPHKLIQLFREVTLVTLSSCLVFVLVGFGIAWGFGFSLRESAVIGAAAMFSSTIIGLKLLPARALHHQHIGEIVIGVLLLQDLLAIVILLGLQGLAGQGSLLVDMGGLFLLLPMLIAFTFLVERYVLRYLWQRFDTVHEYVFLTALGWCLGIAELAHSLGLSHEIGAFVAGVALANSPIARFIAESLRPLRDFFLVLYFFALGAGLELGMLGDVIWPALTLAVAMVVIKPAVFRVLLGRAHEDAKLATEVGVRLGQMSEFALFIAVLAAQIDVIGTRAAYLLQFSTVLTFLASSYVIGVHYPSPIAASAALRRD